MILYSATPIVFVVDNDSSVRESLALLIQGAGWQSQTFASATEFLAYHKSTVPSCLILDLTLPDMNGLELQDRISTERCDMPIIFLSSHVDISMAVKAIKRGALEFLIKPFDFDMLLSTIRSAIKRSELTLTREIETHRLRADYESLSRREREVMAGVASGLLNKEVGTQLGISEITVKAHRGNVMRKMKAASFAHLVNMASRLRVVRHLTTSSAQRGDELNEHLEAQSAVPQSPRTAYAGPYRDDRRTLRARPGGAVALVHRAL
jgi:FixJ family two-component response regulator